MVGDAAVDERADALKLARYKAQAYAGLEPEVQRRLSGFLARRGYGYDVTRSVLEKVLEPDENDEVE